MDSELKRHLSSAHAVLSRYGYAAEAFAVVQSIEALSAPPHTPEVIAPPTFSQKLRALFNKS